MGVFQDMVTVVNRAPITLNVRFDGSDITLPLGESQLPAIAVDKGKNQNPIMGSQDPYNPSITGARYLFGIKGRDNCEPLTAEEWNAHCDAACRMDWKVLMDEIVGPKEHVEVKGKGKKTQARSSFDAGVRVGGGVNHLPTE